MASVLALLDKPPWSKVGEAHRCKSSMAGEVLVVFPCEAGIDLGLSSNCVEVALEVIAWAGARAPLASLPSADTAGMKGLEPSEALSGQLGRLPVLFSSNVDESCARRSPRCPRFAFGFLEFALSLHGKMAAFLGDT